MLATKQLRFLIGAYLITCVAAGDAGDDFSNNLFSDLAPYVQPSELANPSTNTVLHVDCWRCSERVTMQYMSQSTGCADNIVLAMAPLGIIAAVVGAIRVGGPSWLRAVIGRARETRATAESELMSSTSGEVCELWNGQAIVRVMGNGPIREFIILLPKGDRADGGGDHVTSRFGDEGDLGDEYLPGHEPSTYERISGKLASEGRDPEESPNGPPIVILRNIHASAPNLTLNVHSQVSRIELYIVATLGIILQLGVLVYFGFTTYYPTLKLRKDGKSVARYAFPCSAIGTILVVAGMLLCSHIVEASTSEKLYRPKHGTQAYVVWLQKSGIVNDQKFEPFAIFPPDSQAILTTSQRANEKGRWRSGMAIISTLVTVIGYIIQFIDLRAMHWSASVTLLGAVFIMTMLRVVVRRDLARFPHSQRLVSEHELDWLAMTLANLQKDPWPPSDAAHGGKHNRPWDWKINAVEKPSNCERLKPLCSGINMPNPTINLARQDSDPNASSMAPRALRIRRDLGELANWYGPASTEAIALARAIEIVMNTLFNAGSRRSDHNSDENSDDSSDESSGDNSNRGFIDKELTWSIAVLMSNTESKPKPEDKPRRKCRLKRKFEPATESEPSTEPKLNSELVRFSVEQDENGNWKAHSDEMDAALSLWLYSVHETGNSQDGDQQGDVEGSIKKKVQDIKFRHPKSDTWLRSKGTSAERCLTLLGQHTPALYRDLNWWLPNGAARIIKVEQHESTECVKSDSAKDDNLLDVDVDERRIVGYVPSCHSGPGSHRYMRRQCSVSPKKDGTEKANAILAVESYTPLKALFAQHMFSGFMWSVAKKMRKPIAKGASISKAHGN
ncbi:hypothetical protein QQX98_002048 [Neonectria punicea]|uniref:Uncharacterized protein n=1 Tax=Neonectria punicea TaxID=979145 RepID=A0ABR1HK36_9HYPO